MAEGRATDRRVGVHSLTHFTLAVPDLGEAERFYTAFGLDVERLEDRLLLRTDNDDHVWADIVGGERKKLRSIRLGVFEEDMSEFAARLADTRFDPPGAGSNAIWCRTPDGLPIEVAVMPKTSPDSKSSFDLPTRFHEHRGAGPRSRNTPVRPRRLAHLAMYTASVPEALAFYEERLGLRLSDRSGDDVAFIHGPHGSDHHLIAIARSDGPGLHHCSWDVATIAEVGLGASQMEAAGYRRGWGLGRHVLGSNYFHYVRDPWGSYAEYSADMDYIPATMDWPGGDHPGEDSFYQWGPTPPEDFVQNYETTPMDEVSGRGPVSDA